MIRPRARMEGVNRLIIEIPEASPSGNKYAYSHWSVRYKDKARWLSMMSAAVIDARIPKEWKSPCSKISMTVLRMSKKKLDVDNGYSGIKGIIDNLRAMGLIKDDDPDSLMLDFKNVPMDGTVSKTTMILEKLYE